VRQAVSGRRRTHSPWTDSTTRWPSPRRLRPPAAAAAVLHSPDEDDKSSCSFLVPLAVLLGFFPPAPAPDAAVDAA
jgi:hypothetical protein